tara:strand:+ start:435 stop:743 length:309 start_codon:yes stop_codon:yes gene_type:complete
MKWSPDAVYLYIPLMKELGLSWSEIKHLPRPELEGLLYAASEYSVLHSMDGYTDKSVADHAKHNPEIRGAWSKYQNKKAEYEDRMGIKSKRKGFEEIFLSGG